MLTNPFYIGRFEWGGGTYQGTHASLISPELYAQAQSVLCGHNKPKYGKHEIAFRGMLTCAHDNCTVTAELKKNKYVYYRCTGHKGPCALPRFREQEIAERMGHVLKDVSIPEEVVQSISASLQRVHVQMHNNAAQERSRLEREPTALHCHMDAAYSDKLDGKISTDFWQRKTSRLADGRIQNQIADFQVRRG
jgi:site-specific DNA recombinase